MLKQPIQNLLKTTKALLKPGAEEKNEKYRCLILLLIILLITPLPGLIVFKLHSLHSLYRLGFWVSLITLFAVAILSGVITLLWRQQKRMYLLELESQSLKVQHESGRKFWALTQSIHDAAITSDNKGIILDWNPGAERLFGHTEEEITGENIIRLIPERLQKVYRRILTKIFNGKSPRMNNNISEFVGLRKNGEEFSLELSLARWKTENREYFTAIIRDISERKKAEMRIFRLTQLYSALSRCNEAIVRSKSKEELFPQICRNAVEFGGLKMAWIGQIDEKSTEIFVVTSYGDTTGYLESENFEKMCKQTFFASSGKSINFLKPFWFQDIQKEGILLHQEMAKKAGFGSSASLPFFQNEKIAGMLNVYSEIPHAFDDEARNLLSEIVMDIGFALDNFAREDERKQSVLVLEESEQRFRSLVEQPLAGVGIIQDGKFKYVNPRYVEIMGYDSAEELTGVELTSLIAEKDYDKVFDNMRTRIEDEKENLSYEFTAIRKDNTLVDIGVHGSRTIYQGKPAIIGLMQDITEKKKTEEQIQRYINQLQNVFMETVGVVNTMIEMRDPYTAGHERRVAEIAVAIGTEMGFDERRLEGLKISGWLHDLGKITIPAEMLAKPRKLTESEFNLIKEHPQTGFDILAHVEFPWPVGSVVLQHHERIDGSGYPFGLKGDEILLEARITAVADVVEAMASHRPYRASLGLEKALVEIEHGGGIIYDAEVSKACLRIFRESKFKLPEF
jgi:PAS domain S-box-containing protein